MKKTLLILSLFASASLFAESPVPEVIELPENPCAYIADAGCHIGPDGKPVITPYDICDTHGICEVPEIEDADEKFLRKQARTINNLTAKAHKIEIFKTCVENATNLKSIKSCRKDFKKKSTKK